MWSRFARIVCACAGPRLHAGHGASSVARDAAPARQLLGPVGLKMRALSNAAACCPDHLPQRSLPKIERGGDGAYFFLFFVFDIFRQHSGNAKECGLCLRHAGSGEDDVAAPQTLHHRSTER
jgi:hypothetical protein